MYFFRQLGLSIVKYIDSFILFFCFIGHLSGCIGHICLRRLHLSRISIVKIIFHSGPKLVLPLILISILTGISMVFNINTTLSRFNLQHQARMIAQNILTHDVVPLLIAVLLSIQSALNLINAGIDKTHYSSQQVIIAHIIPIIIGVNITGALLYAYSISAFFLSIYLTFFYVLHINVHEYFLHITGYITAYDIIYSMLKTSLFCTVVSLTISYYYYVTITRRYALRKTVSQIMTRSFVWLAISSVCLNYCSF